MHSKIIQENQRKIALNKKSSGELKIPYNIINKSIPELENMLFDIFINFHNRGLINKEDLQDLLSAYKKAKKAHGKTGIVRKGSKKPYIHHPLAVTIYAMHLSTLMKSEKINVKYLLLGALYHDTIEDTKIFSTKDTGKQFSKFAKKYGIPFGIVLYYVTKIPLNIDQSVEKLENHIKRLHLAAFNFSFVPIESRIIKIADRIMNLADLQYLSQTKRISTIHFTKKHFSPVLKYLPMNIKNIFQKHLTQVKITYNISDEDLEEFQKTLRDKET